MRAVEEGYGQERPLLTESMKAKHAMKQVRDLFPSLMTLALFAIDGSAIVNGVRLASDPSARYWIGRAGYFTLIVPILIGIAHVTQSFNRRPGYLAIVFSAAIPPFIFIVLGYMYMVPVSSASDRLSSTDCITFREKWEIEQGYRAAETFWQNCLPGAAIERGTTEEALAKALSIKECHGYDLAKESSGFAHQWDYLEALEEREKCSGWCRPGEHALWASNPAGWDSCASAAGMSMKDKVARNAFRMMVNGVFGFVVAALSILIINEWIRSADDPTLHW